jgi:hypothetical protein
MFGKAVKVRHCPATVSAARQAIVVLRAGWSYIKHFRKWCNPEPQLLSGFFLKKNPHARLSRLYSISENAVDQP